MQPSLRPLEKQDFDLDRDEIFPAWFWERLAKALRFTSELLHEDGTIPQIGDNDSGRFLKLHPVYDIVSEKEAVAKYMNLSFPVRENALYYDENILNHEHLAEAYRILCRHDDVSLNFETIVLQSLTKKIPAISLTPHCMSAHDDVCVQEFLDTLPPAELDRQEYHFPKPKEDIFAIRCYPYAGMGLYIFKSSHLYMSVRSSEVGQNGNGGHAHNDQLSLTLRIDGEDIIVDPGTYLYTPLPERRNEFRATAAHFTIQKEGMEQNPWHPGRMGLFSMVHETTFAKVLLLTLNAIVMEHSGFGEKVYRVVEILENEVRIQDFGRNITKPVPHRFFSEGYGKCTRLRG